MEITRLHNESLYYDIETDVDLPREIIKAYSLQVSLHPDNKKNRYFASQGMCNLQHLIDYICSMEE